ncbi:hypothetical protein EJ06DRAFT_13689 [Trichodelitschia bisporula]|uniref:Uncharacterized protein n=1 Tax=Trichodelitschia bisporula TaxID=703511 RepID=A0A6G1IAH6_9PEZI|nr:hypothetical protein EJ06DRAFT_13689 [Trichodelitschia bisporula]
MAEYGALKTQLDDLHAAIRVLTAGIMPTSAPSQELAAETTMQEMMDEFALPENIEASSAVVADPSQQTSWLAVPTSYNAGPSASPYHLQAPAPSMTEQQYLEQQYPERRVSTKKRAVGTSASSQKTYRNIQIGLGRSLGRSPSAGQASGLRMATLLLEVSYNS